MFNICNIKYDKILNQSFIRLLLKKLVRNSSVNLPLNNNEAIAR